jgi:hypothetical protein
LPNNIGNIIKENRNGYFIGNCYYDFCNGNFNIGYRSDSLYCCDIVGRLMMPKNIIMSLIVLLFILALGLYFVPVFVGVFLGSLLFASIIARLVVWFELERDSERDLG